MGGVRVCGLVVAGAVVGGEEVGDEREAILEASKENGRCTPMFTPVPRMRP